MIPRKNDRQASACWVCVQDSRGGRPRPPTYSGHRVTQVARPAQRILLQRSTKGRGLGLAAAPLARYFHNTQSVDCIIIIRIKCHHQSILIGSGGWETKIASYNVYCAGGASGVVQAHLPSVLDQRWNPRWDHRQPYSRGAIAAGAWTRKR